MFFLKKNFKIIYLNKIFSFYFLFLKTGFKNNLLNTFIFIKY